MLKGADKPLRKVRNFIDASLPSVFFEIGHISWPHDNHVDFRLVI